MENKKSHLVQELIILLKTVLVFQTLLLGAISAANGREKTPETNYVLHCSGCHGLDGRGSEKGRIPNFLGSLDKISSNPLGLSYIARVPGVRDSGLSASETAQVLNYVMQKFGSGDPADRPFDAQNISRYWLSPGQDVVKLRAEVCLQGGRDVCSAYPWH